MQRTEWVSRPGWSRRDGDRFRATFVNAMQGHMEAAEAFAGLLRLRADFSMAWISENMAYRGEVGERLREGLRKARVPEESPAGKE